MTTMRKQMGIGAALALLVGAGGCGESDDTADLLHEVASQGTFGLIHSGLPPLYSGCGRFQPGYDPGDPMADPPVQPMLDGSPYSDLTDGFCTVALTRTFTTSGETVTMQEDIYVVEMGDVAPEVEASLPPHIQHIRSQLADGPAHYCSFTWALTAEPVEGYPSADVQRYVQTLESVSHYCSREYAPSVVFEPGYTTSELVIRSTDRAIPFFIVDTFLEWQGGLEFRGFAGIPDSGGATMYTEDAGWMTFYEACTPTPTAMGPGVCPVRCRLFSSNNQGTMPLCTFDDVQALPANRDLVDPVWMTEHPELCEAVYGEC